MIAQFSAAALAVATATFDGLWEGTLIVGAVWLLLRCAPGLGAATRYALWFCALAAPSPGAQRSSNQTAPTISVPSHRPSKVAVATARAAAENCAIMMCSFLCVPAFGGFARVRPHLAARRR